MLSSSSSSNLSGLVNKGEGSSNNTNGDGTAFLNGFSTSSGNGHTNGLANLDMPNDQDGFKPLYEGSRLDRTEFIRITLQSLKELGFE